jgi:hypothetical protein
MAFFVIKDSDIVFSSLQFTLDNYNTFMPNSIEIFSEFVLRSILSLLFTGQMHDVFFVIIN